jgi:hypothetical protein
MSADQTRHELHGCAAISLQRHEPLAGTASRVDHWLLLSYSGPFGEHALPDSDLRPAVKNHLEGIVASVPNARLQLIKGKGRGQPSNIICRAVTARQMGPFYSTFTLGGYDQLLDLDADALFAPAGAVERAPFYLVCTNGRRDPCCAQYGAPMFEALHRLDADHVWRCSHLGGHRFAANVIAFPHGIYYGRMRPRLAQSLLQAAEQGELLLDHYRGRACYDPVVQAGEAALRRHTGELGLEAFRLDESVQLAEDEWRIRFTEASGRFAYRLSARAVTSAEKEFVSCRSDKQRPVTRYEVQVDSAASAHFD